MTNKSLILGVVALCALPVAGHAQVLLSENFNGLAQVTSVSSGPVGTQFTGTNYRILGPGTAPCSGAGITQPGNHCLVLTGLAAVSSSTLVSKPVTLEAGTTYLLSFDAFGNAGTTINSNELKVTLGDDFNGSTGMTFMLSNSPVSGGREEFSIMPTSTQSVSLMFSSLSRNIGNNGPVLDNIVLEAPEPATLGLLALGLLGGAGAGFARRKHRN
jgi:hypothetical protein